MRHRILFLRLTVYYAVLAAIVSAINALLPSLMAYLPIGATETLMGSVTVDPFTPLEIGANHISGLGESMVWIAGAVVGTILLMLPVSWVYIDMRAKEALDQSLVETMLVLPVAVAGIVVVVQNSLALAFSLAGIVAGVQFRNTLKDPGDSLFILLAIGTGLAAGVGAAEVAAVATLTFNYVFVVLWALDYGGKRHGHRYMRRSRKKDHDDDENGENGDDKTGWPAPDRA
jgi:Domain of unknown function (DUF4956)